MIGNATWLSAPVSPWPGKCLAVAVTCSSCWPLTAARHILGHQLRVRGERPDADDRVGRVDVDVGVRGEVGVDADRPQLLAGDLVRVVGQLRVAGRTEGHRAGELGGRRADPGDEPCSWSVATSAARGCRRRCGPLQTVGEAGDLGRVVDVAGPGEVDDAAEVVLRTTSAGLATPNRVRFSAETVSAVPPVTYGTNSWPTFSSSVISAMVASIVSDDSGAAARRADD